MTREDALKRISELSCAYENIRITECPHCRAEVESMVKMLMKETEMKKKSFYEREGSMDKIEVLKMIAEDMKNNARDFDGRPGRTVAVYFAHQGAAIATLANIMRSTIEDKGDKP